VNIARTKATKEARHVALSGLARPSDDPETDAQAVDRFAEDGHWVSAPRRWDDPSGRLEIAETFALVRETLETLPPRQREVITLRDVEGWSGEEVCNALGLTATNQRVLLHRARTTVRRALAGHLESR
jgi:RNA polymerase sigma-70 factor (ECF subfamily)